jgi:hypothetical protein
VTDAEWDTCTEPCTLLSFLRESGRASDRKLRLFAVACLAGATGLLEDGRSRRALAVAEAYAEGCVGSEERREARRAAVAVAEEAMRQGWGFGLVKAAYAAYYALARRAPEAAEQALHYACQALADASAMPPGLVRSAGSTAFRAVEREQRAKQVGLVRDLFGNPFRPIRIDPSWLAWGSGTVVRLAGSIYEERRWEDLPVLGDALEEAGCTDGVLLSHCRGPGPHARGCFVVDSLLRCS